MLSILVVIGIVFAMQAILGFFQMRNLTDEFIQLRRKGKVAFGRKSGGFRAGAVVMFRIDEDRLGMPGAGDQADLVRAPGPGCHIL